MSTLTTSIDDLGNVIERGLRFDLKNLIKKKLLASVDQVLEDMAIEIAGNIVVRAESMRTIGADSFGPETRVVVQFNLKEPQMIYDTKTKTVSRRDVVER